MCGIGRSAIYLCHKTICTHPDINCIFSYPPIPAYCQCGGTGYLGGTICDTGVSQFKYSAVYSQCLTHNIARSALVKVIFVSFL